MSARSCRVSVEDLSGIFHSVEVTAETLYEAVARGLVALRGNEWVAGLAQNLNVRITVTDVRVEHQVNLREFTQWLDRPARSPKDVIARQRIREILGMPSQG